MKNKRYIKRNNKQKANQIIKKMKAWLWYEKKITPMFCIKNEVAIRTYLKYYGIEYDQSKHKSKALFVISLKESGKYPELIARQIRKPRKRKKGDRKGEYLNYLRSEEWQKKREEIFALRGRKCERCEKDLSNKIADVHHKTYERLFNEEMEDLEVLCRPCHNEHHRNEKRNKKEVKAKTKKKNPVKKKTLSFRQKCQMLETEKGRLKLKQMGYNFTKKSA